jgi:hypothetical protein
LTSQGLLCTAAPRTWFSSFLDFLQDDAIRQGLTVSHSSVQVAREEGHPLMEFGFSMVSSS